MRSRSVPVDQEAPKRLPELLLTQLFLDAGVGCFFGAFVESCENWIVDFFALDQVDHDAWSFIPHFKWALSNESVDTAFLRQCDLFANCVSTDDHKGLFVNLLFVLIC